MCGFLLLSKLNNTLLQRLFAGLNVDVGKERWFHAVSVAVFADLGKLLHFISSKKEYPCCRRFAYDGNLLECACWFDYVARELVCSMLSRFAFV